MTPILPLETFRTIMGYNPFHFWGLAGTVGSSRVTSSCNDVLRQYAWQDTDAAGRNDILDALEQAEARLRSYLGYSVAPHYVVEEVTWPRYNDISFIRHGTSSSDGRGMALRLNEGYIQSAGAETRTLIDTPTITYSDVDGDGLNDTATFSVTTTVTDTDQIAVYFNATDRFDGSAVSERWRIQPLRVSISGGTATIKGAAWLFVKPLKYEGVSVADLDPTTVGNFATTVNVYRRYTEVDGETVDNAQATLVWETTPCSGWYCCSCSDATYTPADSSADPAAVAKAVARVGIRDARTGLVVPAQSVRNATSGIWSQEGFDTGYEPDRVIVRYKAGLSLEDGQMQKRWQVVVARLAAAELARPICACDKANRELYKWQFDLARTGGANDEQYGAISAEDLNNPFGTARGHVYAWKEVKYLRNLVGFLP